MRPIIFTDLDGTLLDHFTYSFEPARRALALAKKKGVPIVFCTSKTRAETELWQRRLKIKDPFIVQNGGAIFIPKGYFSFDFKYDKIRGNYFVIELGTPYKKLRQALKKIAAQTKCKIIGFGDMTPKDLMREVGLSATQARLAKLRGYDEPFKVIGGKKEVDKVLKAIKKAGLNYTSGGIYFHIMGESDKGRAVKILTQLFKRQYGKIKTIALGDSLNDAPMLKVVDVPILVQWPDGSWDIRVKKARRVVGIGPRGWNKTILEMLR